MKMAVYYLKQALVSTIFTFLIAKTGFNNQVRSGSNFLSSIPYLK